MRNGNTVIIGVGVTGTLIYTGWSQRIDRRMNHPLIKEGLMLLQNNDDVVQLIGAPVLPKIGLFSRAAIGEEFCNFTLKVKGPRGVLDVELAGVAALHKDIGVSALGKARIEQEIKGKSRFWVDDKTGEQKPIPTNLEELNYNEYYVPDKKLCQDYYDLANKPGEEDSRPLSPNDKFWKFEYLFAEVDKSSKVLVAPDEKKAQKQQVIYARNTYGDVKKEFQERMNTYRSLKNLTVEEKSEFNKIRQQEKQRQLGYARTYLIAGVSFFAMNFYIMFRKNKRISVTGSVLQSNLENLVKKNLAVMKIVGDNNLHFIDTSLGARIGDSAEFAIPFMHQRGSGLVDFKGKYNEATGGWKLEDCEVRFKDLDGQELKDRVKIKATEEL